MTVIVAEETLHQAQQQCWDLTTLYVLNGTLLDTDSLSVHFCRCTVVFPSNVFVNCRLASHQSQFQYHCCLDTSAWETFLNLDSNKRNKNNSGIAVW